MSWIFSNVCLALLPALAGTLLAAPEVSRAGPSESEVKAAFVFQFARFIEWPPRNVPSHDEFVACVVGSDSLGSVLRSVLSGKTVSRRPVAFREQVGEHQASDCDLVFIAGSERKRFGALREMLAAKGVLTVGDWPGFAAEGGVIGFYTDEDRVRFEVNVTAAQKAGLVISSQLLKLARIVTERK